MTFGGGFGLKSVGLATGFSSSYLGSYGFGFKIVGLNTALFYFLGSSNYSSIISSSSFQIYDLMKGLLNGFVFSSFSSALLVEGFVSLTGLFLKAATYGGGD